MSVHQTEPAELMQTIQHCAEAYRLAMSGMPPNPDVWVRAQFQEKGYLAFCAHLPVLVDLPSIQTYFACIGHGAAIGAIDTIDAGRLCHIANCAMSAWKLANLTLPAAESKDRRAWQKEKRIASPPPKGNQFSLEKVSELLGEACQLQAMHQTEGKNTTPLPSKGNHPSSANPADPNPASASPTSPETPADPRPQPGPSAQRQLFRELRARGIKIPSDGQLAKQPRTATYYCNLAESLRAKQENSTSAPAQEPNQEPDPDRQEEAAAA